MREQLEKIEEERLKFTATFSRFGLKNGYRGPEKTVLLKDVKDAEGNILTDHLWFSYTKGFAKLNLQENDEIEFNARCKRYLKGYFGYREDVEKDIEEDFKLSHPSKVKLLNRKTADERN